MEKASRKYYRTYGLSGLKNKVREAIVECLALTKQCSDQIRTLSYLLHSPILEDEGLAPALQAYVDGFGRRSGMHADLDIPVEIGYLPPEIEFALFRVVQESLTNAHLRSGGSRVRVRLVRTTPDEVTLEVEEDDHGIPREILEKIRAGGVMPGGGPQL